MESSGDARFGAGAPWCGGDGEDLEVELLVELASAALHGGIEELVGHGHDDAVVAGGVLAEGDHQLGCHEAGIAGLGERVAQCFRELLRGGWLQEEADPDATAEGQELLGAELLGEPAVTAEHDGEKGAGVELGGGEQAELIEDRGLHLLRFIDDEDRTEKRGLDVRLPALAEDAGAGPAIVRRELDPEEVAEFAVEVGDAALRSAEDADGEILVGGELVDQQPEGDRLAEAGVAGDEGEAALAGEVVGAPAEVFDLGGEEERLGRDLGGEGVPLEAGARRGACGS